MGRQVIVAHLPRIEIQVLFGEERMGGADGVLPDPEEGGEVLRARGADGDHDSTGDEGREGPTPSCPSGQDQPITKSTSSFTFSTTITVAISAAMAVSQRGVTNSPIFGRDAVRVTRGMTAKGS